jgi:hypothetical protein
MRMTEPTKSRTLTLTDVRRIADHHGLELRDACREIHALTGRMPSPERMRNYQARLGNIGTSLHCAFMLYFTLAMPTPAAVLAGEKVTA